ncbi:MAG TPA: hypothetical protein VM121_00745 [Acidimicrobiales bacterium]|nr:hypothetical protein [Acidimicrobiales bacterium]
MTTDETQITADDIADLNRTGLAATATIGRILGLVLMVLSAIGVLAWLWITASSQGLVNSGGRFGSSSEEDMTFTQRLDLLASTSSFLMSAVLVGGVGMAVRLISELLLARTGGSITGIQVGDRPDPEDFEDVDEADGVPLVADESDEDWAPETRA